MELLLSTATWGSRFHALPSGASTTRFTSSKSICATDGSWAWLQGMRPTRMNVNTTAFLNIIVHIIFALPKKGKARSDVTSYLSHLPFRFFKAAHNSRIASQGPAIQLSSEAEQHSPSQVSPESVSHSAFTLMTAEESTFHELAGDVVASVNPPTPITKIQITFRNRRFM